MLYNYNRIDNKNNRNQGINQNTLKILHLFNFNYKASFYLREIARLDRD